MKSIGVTMVVFFLLCASCVESISAEDEPRATRGCDEKDKALTDLASIAVMKSNGFKFDFTVPNADNNGVGQNCVANGEKAKWFGWSGGNAAGTLSATFTGYGEVTVDFGNCWDAGNVKLYLDSKLISTAPVGMKSQKATFAYTPGSVLKLKDENGNAVVMLNSISVNCNGCGEKDKALTDLASIAVMKSNGFKFDFTVPNADHNGVGQNCVANGEKAKWFGWSGGNAAGTLSATFTGHGEVTVDFGNCWTAGNVKLYLDSKLISTAPVRMKSQKATFAYTPGSVLKLKDEDGNAVVMLNSISVNCNDLKPTVESSADYSHAYRGSLLLDDGCERNNPPNYWLSPHKKTGEEAYIILNLGKVTQFNRFKIKNTHNGHSNDRGAKRVGLYTSNSKNGPWKLKADKLITDARKKGCNVPLEEVTIATTDAQFIKLVIDSYYGGGGGGLKYLAVDLVPESILIQKANWFYIISDLNSQAIQIRGRRKNAKNDVVMWFKTPLAHRLWRWVGNMLVSKLNGMALTIRDGNRNKRATVWMMPLEDSKEQQWRLEDGRLVSGLNGLVLNVKNDDKSRGNTVWMWEKKESKAQKWKLQLAAGVLTENYCTGEPGCCTEKHKCKELWGGCDNHDQCQGDNIFCGKNNCPRPGHPWPGFHWAGANCCTKEGSYRCGEYNPLCEECTKGSPCARGFGDCDNDDECAGNLKCGDGNCPWDQHRGWGYNKDDCCV